MHAIESSRRLVSPVGGQFVRQLKKGFRVTHNELHIRLILLKVGLDDTDFFIDVLECHSKKSR